MSKPTTAIEELFYKIESYTDTSLELLKMKILDSVSDLISIFISKIILIIVVVAFSIFLNIALALYFGTLLESNYQGFALVAFIYFLISISIYFLFRTSIRRSLKNTIIENILTKRKYGQDE